MWPGMTMRRLKADAIPMAVCEPNSHSSAVLPIVLPSKRVQTETTGPEVFSFSFPLFQHLCMYACMHVPNTV